MKAMLPRLVAAGCTTMLASLLTCALPAIPRSETLRCECVLATTLCNLARFDEAAGKPRQTWTQDAFTAPGRTLARSDLSAACWRKRDAKGAGDGLCRSRSGNEADADTDFSGELLADK